MDLTLLEIITEAKLLHDENAVLPIDLTLFPIVTEVKPLHPSYLQLIVYQFVLIKTVEK